MMNPIPKLKIIIVYPYKFSDSYYRKYEISFLKKTCDVEVWDVGYFLHPKFTNAIATRSSNDECVKTVANWSALFRLAKQLRQTSNTKIVFFQFFQPVNFKTFLCSLIIKLRADFIVDFYNAGVPLLEAVESGIADSKPAPRAQVLWSKLIQRAKAREYTRLYREFRTKFFSGIANLLSIQPTHRLIAGKAMDMKYRFKTEQKGIRVLTGLSWDFSNSLAYKSSSGTPLVHERYAVLLDGAGPAYASDDELIARDPVLTSDKWYPALTSFFDRLEQELKVKIVIAAHPKSRFPDNPEEFGFRRVFYGHTEELVRHAAFVITRFSTAISYAVIHGKPVLAIYNEQMKSRAEVFRQVRLFSEILSINPINIDAPPASLPGYLSISADAYDRYRQDYLTTLGDPSPNHRLIVEGLHASMDR